MTTCIGWMREWGVGERNGNRNNQIKCKDNCKIRGFRASLRMTTGCEIGLAVALEEGESCDEEATCG